MDIRFCYSHVLSCITSVAVEVEILELHGFNFVSFLKDRRQRQRLQTRPWTWERSGPWFKRRRLSVLEMRSSRAHWVKTITPPLMSSQPDLVSFDAVGFTVGGGFYLFINMNTKYRRQEKTKNYNVTLLRSTSVIKRDNDINFMTSEMTLWYVEHTARNH